MNVSTTHISRRDLLASAVFLGAAGSVSALAAQAGPDKGIRLVPMPTRIFKTPDAGHERTESWVFWVFVETSQQRPLQVDTMQIKLLSGGRTVQTTGFAGVGLQSLTIVPPLEPKLMDGSASSAPIFWPQAVRVRCCEPAAAKVDSMTIELRCLDRGRPLSASCVLPVEAYGQKTSLVYPFKGKGVITQAGVTNGGHKNRSGQFALDGVGLGEGYCVYVSGKGRKHEDYAGWGRALIAPADGTVVSARVDRPDQPDPEKSDPKFYAPEYPRGGDPGNHLVIDHGNGEFSMIAHFQAGSIAVKVGDPVRQGQALGKLGSSGDTQTPHCHYQLQSGPDWEWADGLPCAFANVEEGPLVRGVFFEAG
jgi:Peptidase family M23